MGSRKEMKFTATEGSGKVSAILDLDDHSKALLVLAHGAGAGMNHAFMEALSNALLAHDIAVFRFNFPYMEGSRGRPDPPARAMMTIENAIRRAGETVPGLPVFAGGKSFGGRMSSQLAGNRHVHGLRGLVFFGFPLHGPGKAGTERAAHLKEIKVPMLFLQGTRDALATPELITNVTDDLPSVKVRFYEGADHSFNVLKSLGISHEEMIQTLAADAAGWIKDQP